MSATPRLLARDAPREVAHGLCACGCGERTSISKYTARSLGYVKGEPRRFVNGHGSRGVDSPWEICDTGYKTPCWVWRAGLMGEGYAIQAPRVAGGTRLVHRQHYEAIHGPVPIGLDLDHLCRVRQCVNPEHVEPVTRAENARRGARAKLTVAAVREIRASAESIADLALRFGVAPGTVWHVRTGSQWKDVA